jgi:subtilisin family serine protease
MQKLIYLILIASVITLNAQTKYFIYFKDKYLPEKSRLEKGSSYFIDAANQLSEKSIERRIKNMGEDEFITYEDLTINEQYLLTLENIGIKTENKLKWFNAISAYLNEQQIQTVSNLEFVEKVEPVKVLVFKNFNEEHLNPLYKYNVLKNNLNYGNSFDQLQLSDIPIVHKKGITGNGVLIGLLDSGFDWRDHESLINAKVLAEYDFVFNDRITANEPGDSPSQHNHGTYVFSIIGGKKDSVLIGASFDSDFILAKTEDIRSETHIEEDNYAAALMWMDSIGVDITSSSLGYNLFDPTTYSYTYEQMDGKSTIVTKAIELAFKRGIITVTSAGNEGDDPWFHIVAPADGFNVIAVGAVNSDKLNAPFSSRGPTYDGRIKPEVVAMGVNVFGASASGFSNYNFNGGTSASAPIVSGVAALLLSAHPHLKNTQVREILLETSDNSSASNNEIGYGLVSALNAIEYPNLEFYRNSYRLHKMFLTDSSLIQQSAKIHYSLGDENFIERQLTPVRLSRFVFEFPEIAIGQEINFYFTYKDSISGAVIRNPEQGNYTFIYGQLKIYRNLLRPDNYQFVISEPYPNPFLPFKHSFVKFNYRSNGPGTLKGVIIDATGQKVKQYDMPVQKGEFSLEWDGYSDNGVLCASGVYYFLVTLNGREYGRKFVLLK